VYRECASFGYDLYSVPITGGPSVQLNPPMPGGRDVIEMKIAPPSTLVVYVADQEVDDDFELYSVPIGGGVAVKLSAPLPPGDEIEEFRFTPDGTRVIYLAGTAGAYELYSVPSAGGSAVKISGPMVVGGSVVDFFLAPDGTRVFYLADQETDGWVGLHSVEVAGGPVVTHADGHVQAARISPDGATLVYRSGDLFAVPVAGGPAIELAAGVLHDDFRIDSTGDRVVYRAHGLFSVPLDGSEPPTRLADATPGADGFHLSGDGSRVVYWEVSNAVSSFDGSVTYWHANSVDEVYASWWNPDPDGDFVHVFCDNCPGVANLTQFDGDGDGAGAACDCDDTDDTTYPGAIEVNDGADNQCPGDPGPGLVDELAPALRFDDPSDRDVLSWDVQPGATGYRVVRSDGVGFDVGCSCDPTAGTSWSDPETPATGAMFAYLARAASPNLGSAGADSTGVERSGACLDTPCP
jgi:hypothetical protein